MRKKIDVIRERAGMDLDITAEVKTNGQSVSLRGRDITLVVRSASGREERLPYSLVTDTKIRFHFHRKRAGFYFFAVCENWDMDHGSTVGDIETAVELVPFSWLKDESIPPESFSVLNVDLGVVNITAGVPGMSAYEVAVHNGFKGTESEWLQSLKGNVSQEQIDQIQKPIMDVANEAKRIAEEAKNAASEVIAMEQVKETDAVVI